MRSRRAEGGEAAGAAAFASVKESPDKKSAEWEVRPCGMLVQKRDPDADATGAAPVPTVRLKVKYGVASHEIYISSQATFGKNSIFVILVRLVGKVFDELDERIFPVMWFAAQES